MRRLSTLITTLALSLSGLVFSPAHAGTTGDLNWTNTSSVTITGCATNPCPSSVVIPASIDIGGGEILDVTTIGISAFEGAALTSINIPYKVTTIGLYAFRNAASLTTVTFDGTSTLTTIREAAFEGASALTSITIPASVTSIESDAFLYASALTAITVPSTNLNYSSDNGVLLNKAQTALIRYPVRGPVPYSIPATVTSIGIYAFNGASALTSITIAPGVTSIGIGAFYNAFALESVTFTSPSSLGTIARSTFFGATSLTSITIPSSVTSIDDTAFSGASALTSITIPSSVTSVTRRALQNLTALEHIEFLGNQPSCSDEGSDCSEILSGSIGTVYRFAAATGWPAINLTYQGRPQAYLLLPPTGLTATAGTAAVTISVTAPTLGPAPTSYVVEAVGDSSKTCTITAPVMSCIVTGLTPGTAYTFTAVASESSLPATSAVSDASNAVTLIAPANSTPTPTSVIANGYRADKLGTVYFAPLSSELSKAAKKQIKTLVTANPSAIYKISGYVQKSSSAKNDASLSLGRAKAVETYLISLGAGINFTVVLDAGKVPTKNGKSSKARRATFYAMTPVVQ
jgi:hypothetical protein